MSKINSSTSKDVLEVLTVFVQHIANTNNVAVDVRQDSIVCRQYYQSYERYTVTK